MYQGAIVGAMSGASYGSIEGAMGGGAIEGAMDQGAIEGAMDDASDGSGSNRSNDEWCK